MRQRCKFGQFSYSYASCGINGLFRVRPSLTSRKLFPFSLLLNIRFVIPRAEQNLAFVKIVFPYVVSVSVLSIVHDKKLGPFTLIILSVFVMSLALSLQLKCFRISLFNQVSRSKNELQPQLIQYDGSVDVDAPNHSLTLSANGP